MPLALLNNDMDSQPSLKNMSLTSTTKETWRMTTHPLFRSVRSARMIVKSSIYTSASM